MRKLPTFSYNLQTVYKQIKDSAGFTLVELLVVIVIIGILAGVVIGVLNPLQQQRRARDGTTKAQIDKMALSAKSLFVSSPRGTGRAPTLLEFARSFASSTDAITNCTSDLYNSTEHCTFTITAQPLSSDCSLNYYSGSGTEICRYAYWRDPDSFIIAAKGVATPQVTFVYYYEESLTTGNVLEGFYACADNYTFSASVPAGCARL